MRALVFDGDGPRFVTDHAEPALRGGEAVIRPVRAGICSTDLEICRGYMGFTGVLGHEFVGVVEGVSDDADERGQGLMGQRVVGSINCVCGACDMCQRGLSNHCRDRTVLGIAGRDGCLADRFVLPLRNLHAVPEVMDDDTAVFTEPVAAAVNVMQRLRIEARPYITVLGDGRLGLLTAQVLARLNASVRVLGKHAAKLELCERWGIRHRLVDDVTPRADQDVVVDCTGSATGLAMAMRLVRPRGTIALKTTVADQQGVDLSPIVIHEIDVVGSRCGPFPDALSLLADEAVEVIGLISRRVRLEDGVEGLRAAAQADVIKVLIEFD